MNQYKSENKKVFQELKTFKNQEESKNIVKKKIGRKPLTEQCNKSVTVYFTKNEYGLLEKIADGRPISSIIRKTVKQYVINDV